MTINSRIKRKARHFPACLHYSYCQDTSYANVTGCILFLKTSQTYCYRVCLTSELCPIKNSTLLSAAMSLKPLHLLLHCEDNFSVTTKKKEKQPLQSPSFGLSILSLFLQPLPMQIDLQVSISVKVKSKTITLNLACYIHKTICMHRE